MDARPSMGVYQISTQADQRFVCKCAETAGPITGYETARIHRGVTLLNQAVRGPNEMARSIGAQSNPRFCM